MSYGRKVLIPQDQYLLRVKKRNSEAFPNGSTDTRVEPGTRESRGTKFVMLIAQNRLPYGY